MPRIIYMIERPLYGHLDPAGQWFGVYLYSLYSEASEFVGQWKRTFVTAYDTLEQARVRWPEAIEQGQQTDPVGNQWHQPVWVQPSVGWKQFWAEEAAFAKWVRTMREAHDAPGRCAV